MNPWQVLSQTEIKAIHQTSLRVLSEIGIVLTNITMRQQLFEAGCTLKN